MALKTPILCVCFFQEVILERLEHIADFRKVANDVTTAFFVHRKGDPCRVIITLVLICSRITVKDGVHPVKRTMK